jgi:hypothetical protein
MKRPGTENGCLPADAPAAAADSAAGPIATRLPARRVTAMLLLAAAALDLTRCGLVAATVRQAEEAAMPVSVGLAAAAVTIWTARGCRRGARWSGLAAFLIGAASAPQASAFGFSAAYTIPDGATAALGVLVAVGVLATAGRSGQPGATEHLITTKRISS